MPLLLPSDSDRVDAFLREFGNMDTEISQSVALLVTVLQKILAKKNLPHLMDLLLRLNYNHHYSNA